MDVYFAKNPYPDPSETQELSEQLSLPENVIKVWFQNKRSRDKQRKFSHSNRMLNKLAVLKNSAVTSSPISNNNSNNNNSSFAQLLQSKFGTYAAMAAVVNAVQQNNQSSNFYHNFLNHHN